MGMPRRIRLLGHQSSVFSHQEKNDESGFVRLVSSHPD